LLYWHPGWKTRFGATYRTAVPQHFQGEATFAITEKYALKPVVTLADFYGFFPNQKAFTTLTTPGTYAVGVATEAFGKNMIAVDLQLQDYRRLKDVVLNFSKTKDTAFQPEQRLAFDFHNAYAVKIGWERPVKGLTVRAGWSFDGTPVPDKSVTPLWPDSSRLNHTVGVSKESKGREISVFYQFMKFIPRTTNVAANAGIYTNGDWKSTAQLFGFSLRLRKGGKNLEMRQ
jgi:long-chain fatty acid transport protein